MPKVKFQVGAEFDVLNKQELDDSLQASVHKFAKLLSAGVGFGKGFFSNINTVITQLAIPNLVSATPNASGGTWAAGSYFFKAAAGNSLGVTGVGNELGPISIALNGTVSIVVNNIDPNASNIQIFNGTSSGGENQKTTFTSNGQAQQTFVLTGPGANSGIPTGPVNISVLPTTPTYTGGYLQLDSLGPRDGYLWSVKNLTYLNFPTAGADLLLNGYSNGDIAYAILNGANVNGTTTIGSNGLIVHAGNRLYLGFRGSVTNAALVMYYEEVLLEDMGKL